MSIFNKDKKGEGDPKPEDSGTPEFVTQEMLNAAVTGAVDQIKGLMLDQQVGQKQQVAPQPVADAPKVTVTQEQIQKALDDDDTALAMQLVNKQNEEKMAVAMHNVRSEFDQKMSTGINALANVTEQVAQSSMPHYQRFKKEITEKMQQLPAEARVDSNILQSVYNMVVGENASVLVEEAQEAAIRQGQEEMQTANASQSGGSKTAVTREAVLEDLRARVFNEGALTSLKNMPDNPDPDQFARRMGYASADDYLEKTNPELFEQFQQKA